MTEKTIVECDRDWCERYYQLDRDPDRNGWAELKWKDTAKHLCPEHAMSAFTAVTEGKLHHPDSDESVKLVHPGEDHGHAHVSVGTHGIQIESLGAGRLAHDEDEGVGIYVHDHLKVLIRGAHKAEPRVSIESDEFPTSLSVTDPEDSFTEIEVPDGDV